MKRTAGWITGITHRINLRNKLLLSFLLLTIMPFGIFTLLTYSNMKRVNVNREKDMARSVLEQTAGYLDYKINNILYASNQIVLDSTINTTLRTDKNLAMGPKLMGDYNNIRSQITNVFLAGDIYKITVYLAPSIYYSNEESGLGGNIGVAFSNMAGVTGESWYKGLETSSVNLLWLPSAPFTQADKTTVHLFSCVRMIHNFNDFNDILGVLKIDILEDNYDAIVQKVSLSDSGVSMIVNSKGNIIAQSASQLIRNQSEGDNLIRLLIDNASSAGQESWSYLKWKKQNLLVGRMKLNQTDFDLFAVIPEKDIMASSTQIKYILIFLLLIIIVFICIIAYILAGSVTKRIRMLSNKMKNVQSASLPSVIEASGSDEISVLINSYNYMIKQISAFSEMRYEMGKERKSTELMALQSQINPHFLYNTLDLINWTALSNNVPEISEIVKALAKYYRLSLSNGKNVILIEDEINQVKMYVKIQNYRFKDKITLTISIEPKIYSTKILKLILQPIVENAILHGILEKDDQLGTITINGKQTDQYIIFEITDDGIGIENEKVSSLLAADGGNERISTGYGLRNVNYRIQLFYGEDCGLSIESVLGRGTSVMIRIKNSVLL